jgi:osmotically-inducible protein OsmY
MSRSADLSGPLGDRLLLGLQEHNASRVKDTHMVQLAAQSVLRDSAYPELRLVSCEFRNGVLTLQGQVSTFYVKQLAQSVVSRLKGIVEINNRIEVLT